MSHCCCRVRVESHRKKQLTLPLHPRAFFATPAAPWNRAKGGELFDRITKKTKFCEAEARFVLLQLLNAVKYLHEHGVVHRDLKVRVACYFFSRPQRAQHWLRAGAKGRRLPLAETSTFCCALARCHASTLCPVVPHTTTLAPHIAWHARRTQPENVLLCGNEDYCIVKVTDFGLAKLVGDQSYLKTTCGTPSYLAPEVLKAIDGSSAATVGLRPYDEAPCRVPTSRDCLFAWFFLVTGAEALTVGCNHYPQGYTKQVDVWSLGVIAYIMLVGFPPFSDDIGWHDKKYTLVEQVMLGKLAFPSPWWDGISPEGKLRCSPNYVRAHAPTR